ncbi:hypothetical protein KY363_05200, partial [Candidatus Woesearchaeota archaeon]|nr:hypothetical protein [Candidatus Woesearchaeota archaeon]
MVTIAHLVAKRMNDLPFVQEAMDKEIINYGGLAEMIRPSIEKELKKKVKPSAVSMALRRFHEENKSKSHKRIRITKESDLSIKSNLFEISVQKSPKIFSALTKLYQSVDFGVGDVLNIIQGNYEVLVISNMKYKERFIETLSDENIIFTTENLAALSMTMPAQCISSPGFFFIITKTLAWEDINIVDMVNTATEVTLILD